MNRHVIRLSGQISIILWLLMKGIIGFIIDVKCLINESAIIRTTRAASVMMCE